MKTQAEIINELAYCTGTEEWHRHWTKAFSYTDGVKAMADQCCAYWLIDAIASHQTNPKIRQDSMLQDFQLWTLKVEDSSASLICERDTDDIALTQEISLTNFPLPEIKLYLTGGVLLLPSEY